MKFALYIVCTVLLIGCLHFCNEALRIKNETSDYITYQDSLKKVIKSRDGTIYLQDQLIVNNSSEIKKLTQKIDGLRKIHNQTKVDQVVEVIQDTLIISDTVVIKENKKFLKLPINITDDNEWYDLQITIDTLGKSILNSLYLKGDISISIGEEDKGFINNLFTKNDIVVAYKSNNPYFKAEGIQSYALNTDKKIGIGLQTGYYLTPKGFQPGIGIGLFYRVF